MAEKKSGTGKRGATAKKSAAGSRTDAAKTKASARSRRPTLQTDLRDFVSARPEGWNHDDWLSFLESLQGRGHDIRDREAIGNALEKERLDLALSAVKGMGPNRRKALVEHYGMTWHLRNASVDEIAAAGNVPRSLAERIKEEVK